MSGSTTELNLSTAVDSDDNADYLTIALANSLRTLDGLFNNSTGHTHNGAHQGGPIGLIPVDAIPDGSITSAKITDATIQNADIANLTITAAKIADGTITSAKIANGTIAGGNIADGAITSAKILDGGIATVDIGNQQITAALLAGGAAASNVGALGGALTGTLPNPSLTNQFAALASAIALTAGTYATAVSLTLPSGTWLVWGAMQFIIGTAGCVFEARITDGTTSFASGGQSCPVANGHARVAVPPFVFTAGTTTFNFQGLCSVAGASISHTSPQTSQARATCMAAIRLA